jgi:hypothetical protein
MLGELIFNIKVLKEKKKRENKVITCTHYKTYGFAVVEVHGFQWSVDGGALGITIYNLNSPAGQRAAAVATATPFDGPGC